MTIDHVRDIVARIEFLDRKFEVMPKGDGFLLQLSYTEPDIHTGAPALQKARKWYISSHATETEIVETAYAACVRSMQHVVSEHFLYRRRRVYSPHFDIQGRIDLCDAEQFDARPPPPDPDLPLVG